MRVRSRVFWWAGMAALLAVLVSCSKSGGNKAAKSIGKLTGSTSDPAVELRMKWAPDSRYLMRMELTRRAQRQQHGQTEMVQHEFSFNQDYALTVTNAGPEDKRGLNLEILSLETSTAVGGNFTLNFDSESQVDTGMENSLSDLLRQSIGGHLHYLLDPNGKVLKVSGVRELLQSAARGSNATASTTLRRVYNPEYFKEILELCTLPENPVKIGKSWPFKREATVGSSAPLLAEGTCTFKGWQEHEKHKCAAIDVDGTLRPRARAPQIVQAAPNQVSFVSLDEAGQSSTNLTNRITRSFAPMIEPGSSIEDGKITGTIWFDPELGLPVESSLEESYSTKVWKVSRQPQTNAPPRSYTSPITQKMSFKLVEAGPMGK